MSREISFAKRRRRSAVAVSSPGLVPPAASRAAREGVASSTTSAIRTAARQARKELRRHCSLGPQRLVWCFSWALQWTLFRLRLRPLLLGCCSSRELLFAFSESRASRGGRAAARPGQQVLCSRARPWAAQAHPPPPKGVRSGRWVAGKVCQSRRLRMRVPPNTQ